MKTYLINVIGSNGTKEKTYANEDELVDVINWLLEHKYIIKSLEPLN